MIFRTIVFLIGAISAMLLSPWIAALCIVVLSVRYRAYEAVALGAFLDLLWLPHDSLLFSLPLCTIVSLLLVWGFEPLRAEFLR